MGGGRGTSLMPNCPHTNFTAGKRVHVVTHDKRVIHCSFVEQRSKFLIFKTEGDERLKIMRRDLKSVTIDKEHRS